MNTLPNELLQLITDYCHTEDCFSLFLTCKHFYYDISCDNTWWKHKYITDFKISKNNQYNDPMEWKKRYLNEYNNRCYIKNIFERNGLCFSGKMYIKNVKHFHCYNRLTLGNSQIYPNLKSMFFGNETIVGLDYNNIIWKLEKNVITKTDFTGERIILKLENNSMIKTNLTAKKIRAGNNFYAHINGNDDLCIDGKSINIKAKKLYILKNWIAIINMNDEGYLYEFGKYDNGIYLDKNIRQIAISNKYIFMLNRNRTEIKYVNNKFGYGKFFPNIFIEAPNEPKILYKNSDIQKITSGEEHLLILADNELYGIGKRVQLGLGKKKYKVRTQNITKSNKLFFKLTDITYNIIKNISSGHNHSLALDIDGNVYRFGYNLNHQFGLSDNPILFSKSKKRIKAHKIFASGDFSAIDIIDSNLIYKNYH